MANLVLLNRPAFLVCIIAIQIFNFLDALVMEAR